MMKSKMAAVSLASSLMLSFAANAAEKYFDIPGYCRVRITAKGGEPTIVVKSGTNGEWFAEVTGAGCDDSSIELVDFIPEGLYFGYGWYVEKPGKFNFSANGHVNGARYSGFDFEGGRSVVLASSITPRSLFYDDQQQVAGLRVSGGAKFAVYPGKDGAFACAIRARDFFDTLGRGSAGVVKKSDKFCVDTWNGGLKEHGELIRRLADDYGIKDDIFLLVHCWQRYGFDRHLPEVWPPDEKFGTAEDAKSVAALAKSKGWLYGMHVNVIDCYSNSQWFAWNKICHDKKGQPIKAWINPDSHEQSFRLLHGFAPASIEYQIDQFNAGGFKPTTMFVDVTGGAQNLQGDNYDQAGYLHRMQDNIAFNERMFDILRERTSVDCGEQTFVSSESPTDCMVGHLDGGDCQWMCLVHNIERIYCWMDIGGTGRIAKVPWFSLVNHDRMILHGVGYSARFEGGRGELCHGIDSDDYICCEMLLGNEPMADCYNRDARDAEWSTFRPLQMDRCLRQVVRKYWLEQPIAKELAMVRVKAAGFVDGEPTHTFVEWENGMVVKVNRGEQDWLVDGVVLPQYGYRAYNPLTSTESKIYRHACGRVVEESSYRQGAKTVRYASTRGVPVPKFTPVEPITTAVGEGGKIKLETAWKPLAGEVAPSGRYQVTYWLADPKFKESRSTSLMRKLGTVESSFAELTKAAFDYPTDLGMDRVSLLVSVAPMGANVDDAASRLHLLGTAAFYRRFTQGFFTNNGGAYELYDCPDRELWQRLPAPKSPIDFGWVKTADGVRVVSEPGQPDAVKELPRF